ncbi:MAG: (2Fe-2S)-binding protein [Bdellovibrionaceae bacterium]|nr:(2Fe-2S)-binding protein [Bdellovibrionales bacterium]MCB9084586.1 (2Fe-2S)-binding protein [Pseudobdellovibrionaceae bacterium]
MYICLCKNLSESRLRELQQSGQMTLDQALQASQAGTDCGACCNRIKNLVDSQAAAADTTSLEAHIEE